MVRRLTVTAEPGGGGDGGGGLGTAAPSGTGVTQTFGTTSPARRYPTSLTPSSPSLLSTLEAKM
jgi:hypothetical protein